MPETISVNGTDLSTLCRNVESLAGLLKTPVRRGENPIIPGRHGSLVRIERIYEANTLVLPIWVIGADLATGNTLGRGPEVTAFYARVTEVVNLFHASTVTIDHALGDGTVRRAVCELADEPLDFTRQLGSPLFGRVAVPLTVPSGFWTETSNTTQTLGGVTGSTLNFTNFTGAGAPMDELTITFGPGNNPKIQQGNVMLQYQGVIGASQTAIFDSRVWEFTGTNGLAMDFTKIVHTGSARWFELAPGTPPQVILSHTGGGSAQVTLTGSKKHMVG